MYQFRHFYKDFNLLEGALYTKMSWDKLNAETLAQSWKSTLSKKQDVVGFENDYVLNVETNLIKLTELLKNLKVCENIHKNDLIEWFKVDKKDKGYKQKGEDDVVHELTAEKIHNERKQRM